MNSSQSFSSMSYKRKLAIASTGLAVGSYAYYYYNTTYGKSLNYKEHKSANIWQIIQASGRIARLVTTTAGIAWDYNWAISRRFNDPREIDYEKFRLQMRKLQENEEQLTYILWESKDKAQKLIAQKNIDENKQQIETLAEEMSLLRDTSTQPSYLSATHIRSAEKLRDMCIKNKGVYIKLGQHLAMLDYMIPSEYQPVLSTLLSKNPVSSWESVSRVIEQDLGAKPHELFHSIEQTPIASASLAQVHIAYGKKDGQKYAIKVQHEDLLYGAYGDMAAITFIVNLIAEIFKGFNYKWLVNEMNRNVPEELNFKMEAQNIEKCTQLFEKMILSGDIAVPKVNKQLSSERVLTMTFEEGCYVTDLPKIQKMGLKTKDIAKNISTIFCDQIYRHGFAHCDPHDANILVRPHPYNKSHVQIVLLDHGLYRQLTPEFRYNYTRLWQGIIMSDENAIRHYAHTLNAGSMFTLLAAILTMKPWDDIVSKDITRLRRKNTAGEKQMLHSYAMKYFNEITIMLGKIPSDLLLVLKTNDCLRHLDLKLGTPVNTTLIVAETVADVILKEDLHNIWFGNYDNSKDNIYSSSNDTTKLDTSIILDSNATTTSAISNSRGEKVISKTVSPISTKITKSVPVLLSWFQLIMRTVGLKMIKYMADFHQFIHHSLQSIYIIKNDDVIIVLKENSNSNSTNDKKQNDSSNSSQLRLNNI